MSLELTPEMAAHAREYGCFVVDGECIHQPHDHPPDHFDPAGCNRPPAALVALMEPCDTCGGFGYRPHHRMEWHDVDCTDCEGRGYPLLTVTVPCGCPCHNDPDLAPDEPGCDECINGQVPAFTARVTAVLPIRRDYTEHGTAAIVVMCEPMITAGNVSFVPADDQRSEPIDIGPNPAQHIGKFLVMCEVVT